MNMVKIFLVEDEKIVREGIKNGIPWEQYGFEFAGEASDGELAFPLIMQSRPDILLTDIRMPFMDGLELAEMVKKELPEIRIMFFSGYDDFEYAKRAIQLGAADYLLKPVNSNQLLEALERMSESIMQERSEKAYKEEFLKQQGDRLFDQIVSGTVGLQELLAKGHEYHLKLSAPRYNLILFQVRIKEAEDAQEQYSDEVVAFEQALKEELEQYAYIAFFNRNTEGYACLITGVNETQLKERVKICTELLVRLVSGYHYLGYFGGIGTSVCRLSEMKSCFQAASKAYAYRYIMEYNQILTEAEALAFYKKPDRINLQEMDVTKINRDIFLNFLKNGSEGDARYFVEEYLESCKANFESLLFRQYILMDVYLAVTGFVTQLGLVPGQLVKEFGDAAQMQPAMSTLDLSVKYVTDLLVKAIRLRNTFSQKKYRLVLMKAREYIGNHYQDEEISLNTAASSVNMSPNHFSTIFSQEMGITFVEYLTKVRMEAAKELLRKTDLRTSEIGYQVGYKDPHYFSYLFKKTQGITPKIFRSGGKHGAEA